MEIRNTNFSGLHIVVSDYKHDDRGSFARLFCDETLSFLLQKRAIKQINHSINLKAGLVRGMHYQNPPFSEMKLVRCIKGCVFDVAVDLRKSSDGFLQIHTEILKAGDGKMMVIPEGFAHGFQALEDESELLYLHTEAYHPEAEKGLNPEDPMLSIKWPMPVDGLSERDAAHPWLTNNFEGVGL
ncbi:MAG: dTDP-4-dehydrorhamnose 3,5-epimerase [Bacteroidota bacterium]